MIQSAFKSLIVMTTLALSGGLALAEAEFYGEVEISMSNSEYVKVEVNGVPSQDAVFTRQGKTVTVGRLDLAADSTTITLIPRNEDLAPVELEIEKDELKETRKGRVLRYLAKRKVSFPKQEEATPEKDDAVDPEPPPGKTDAPKPEDDDL